MTQDIFIKNRQAFCNFCNAPCSRGGAVPSENDFLTMYRWWHCDQCHVSFLVFQDSVNQLELRASVNKKLYIVRVHFELGCTEILVWKDDKPELSGDQLIIKLPSILNLTPKTLANKLQTVLTFL